MGAKCCKLEPLPAKGMPQKSTADPMGLYAPHAYDQLHQGVKVVQADLKTEKGQAQLHKLLASTDRWLNWDRCRNSWPRPDLFGRPWLGDRTRPSRHLVCRHGWFAASQ